MGLLSVVGFAACAFTIVPSPSAGLAAAVQMGRAGLGGAAGGAAAQTE